MIQVNFSFGQSDLGTVCAEDTATYGVVGYSNSEFSWYIDKNGGTVISPQGLGADTVGIRWGYKTGEYLVEVYETTLSGCTGVPATGYVTVQAPEVDLGYDTYEVCEGDSMVFDASGDYAGNYTTQWQNNTWDATYVAKETELIWVKVTDEMGCVRYDTVDFISHQLPVVNLGNDTVLCDMTTTLELAPVDSTGDTYATYEWYSTYTGGVVSLSPTYYVSPGNDSLILDVTDYYGCSGSDTLVIYTCDVSELFKGMPNTFTPNDDSQNDTWELPDFMYMFPDAVLEIFDRWGRLVYHTENVASEPWDGRSKGRQMPMDSYFFVLELNYNNFEAISGTVNLVR